MKYVSYICVFVIHFSCTNKEKNLDWILGNWERTNNSKGTQNYESWTKKSKDEYVGFGYTLKDKDTFFKENIRLIHIKDIWNLEVFGVNETPTLFKFISNTTNSFTCQNLQNEFPKRIKYSFDGENLKAIISDDNNEIPFLFKQE